MAFNISYIFQAIDNFTGVSDKIGKSVNNLKSNMSNLGSQVALTQTKIESLKSENLKLHGELLGAAGTLFAISLPIKQAIAFEDSMADVRKVMDVSDNTFAKLTSNIQDLAQELPVTHKELATMAAAAGQMGIAAKDVTPFVRSVAKMSVALGVSADVAGDSMGVLSSLFKIPIKDIDLVSDAINHLTNTTIAKADPMLNIMTRIAGSAAKLGMTAQQTAGLSATMLALGVGPERASTALMDMLSTFQLIDKASPKVQAALKFMGFDPKRFSRKMFDKPAEAIQEFADTMSKMPKMTQANLISAIFGNSLQGENISKLLTNGEKLSKIMGSVAKETQYAGSITEEFKKRSQTTGRQMVLFGNILNNIAINIGSTLLPAINSMLSVLAKAANYVATFAKEHPILTQYLFGAVMALATFRVGMILTSIVFGTLRIAALQLWTLFAGIPKIIAGVRMAVIALNLAMVASPIGVLVGVFGLLAGLVWGLIQYFGSFEAVLQRIGALASDVGRGIKDSFGWAFDKVAGFLGDNSMALSLGLGAPLVNPNTSLAAQSFNSESRSIVDINLTGNTNAVQNVQSKSTGNTMLNVGKNMAYGG